MGNLSLTKIVGNWRVISETGKATVIKVKGSARGAAVSVGPPIPRPSGRGVGFDWPDWVPETVQESAEALTNRLRRTLELTDPHIRL